MTERVTVRLEFDGQWNARVLSPPALTNLAVAHPTREEAMLWISHAITLGVATANFAIEWEDDWDSPLAREWIALGADVAMDTSGSGLTDCFGGPRCEGCHGALGPRSESPLRLASPRGAVRDITYVRADGHLASCVSERARGWLEGLWGSEWTRRHLRPVCFDGTYSRAWAARMPFYEVGGDAEVRCTTATQTGTDRVCASCGRARALPLVLAGRVWVVVRTQDLRHHSAAGARVLLASDDWNGRILVRR